MHDAAVSGRHSLLHLCYEEKEEACDQSSDCLRTETPKTTFT